MRYLLGLWIVLTVLPVSAQDVGPAESDMQRLVELPAHRSLLARMADPQTELAPFVTDGCSGGMSWGWQAVADIFPDFEAAQGSHPPWESCCVKHDRAYHAASDAGTADQSYDARKVADEALRQCVAMQGDTAAADLALRYHVSEDQIRLAFRVVGDAMYTAVRFGGGPCSGLPWRWGYGYPGCVPGF